MGLLTLWALTVLPETLPPERRNAQSIMAAFLGYAQLLRQPRLLAYAGVGGSFYGGMFAYVAGTPVAYISHHHVSPQHYGLLFALGIVGIMVVNQLNARLRAECGVFLGGRMTQALGHEKAIGGNAQGSVMVKATPASSFIMGKTEFLLQFLVIVLDTPTHLGHGNEPFERHVHGQG